MLSRALDILARGSTLTPAKAASSSISMDDFSDLAPHCWFSRAWERGRDATDLEVIGNTVALVGHYGESRYALDGKKQPPSAEGDYFPADLEGLGLGEKALIMLLIAALVIQFFQFAWAWLGLSPPTVAQICLLLAASGILWTRRDRIRPWIYRARFRTVDEARDFAMRYFHDMSRESVIFIGIDTRRRVIFVHIGRGDARSAAIDLRAIIEKAVASNAIAVLMMHNHPSGECRPSQQDIFITHDLQRHFRDLKIHLVDHVIVTDRDRYSFHEERAL